MNAQVPAKGIRQQDSGMLQTIEQSAELQAVSAASKERAEIESAIIISKRMPRNEAECFQKLIKAASRPSFAEDATYSFPRGTKPDGTKNYVSGPSVNMAREAARVWGNIRHGLRIIRDDDSSRLIQGWAWDMETNTKVEMEDEFEKLIQRKGKGGSTEWIEPDERDLRELTNRRGAILVRNCILQVIPKDLTEDALYQCEQTLQDKASKDPDSTRKRLLADFSKVNVSVSMIEAVIGHPFDQSGPKELTDLRAVLNSIAAGNSTWAEYVKESTHDDAKPKADLNEQLARNAQEQASTGTEAPTSDESQSPPSDAPAGGGPEHMTPEEWNSMLLYLDADPDRIKVKNKTKAALGMKPLDKLQAIPPAKQAQFIAKLLQIGKQEGVDIAF